MVRVLELGNAGGRRSGAMSLDTGNIGIYLTLWPFANGRARENNRESSARFPRLGTRSYGCGALQSSGTWLMGYVEPVTLGR